MCCNSQQKRPLLHLFLFVSVMLSSPGAKCNKANYMYRLRNNGIFLAHYNIFNKLKEMNGKKKDKE